VANRGIVLASCSVVKNLPILLGGGVFTRGKPPV
jgi:hypothetical protein